MRQGQRYFVTFTDNATWYMTTFLLQGKDDMFEAYKTFEVWAVMQHHCHAIKVLQCDRGGKYLSNEFNQHLAKAGTARKLTTHHTPQLNSILECLNLMLLDCICALGHDSDLPKTLWGEALSHVTWLKNWTATCVLNGKMPYEALYGQPSDLSAL